MVDRCLDRLFNLDGTLAGFHTFPPHVQRREEFFLRNSLRGIVEEVLQRSE